MDKFYETKEAVINPTDIVRKVENIPEIAIACFSRVLFDRIVEGSNCQEIASLSNTTGVKKIYALEYKQKKFTLFLIGAGAPMAATDLEDLHAMGCKKFIIFGNCGVLDKNILDCSIIIPTKAIRDEGTSNHYVPNKKEITVNKKYVSAFKEVLDKFGYDYTEGATWTTDAFYRETREKVSLMTTLGAKCVEMEASAMQAVADFRGFDLFIFFYAGDNLDLPKWNKRSLLGNSKLDYKYGISILAFELGLSISK